MIVLSGALVLVALVLLVFGALDRNLPYVYASIGVSVLSLLLLVVGILQRRGELDSDEQEGATPVADTSAERVPALVGAEQDEQVAQPEGHTAELVRPAPVAAAPERAAVVAAQARHGSRRVEPDVAPDHEVDGVDAEDVQSEAAYEEGDEQLEDGELEDGELEDGDLEDEGSGVTVLVVSGRPRYHLEGCRVLRGKEPEPLDRDDARMHGFTPCGVCKPDADETSAAASAPADEQGQSFTEALFGGPLFADGSSDDAGRDRTSALPDRPVQPVLADVEPGAAVAEPVGLTGPAEEQQSSRPAGGRGPESAPEPPAGLTGRAPGEAPAELRGDDPVDHPEPTAEPTDRPEAAAASGLLAADPAEAPELPSDRSAPAEAPEPPAELQGDDPADDVEPDAELGADDAPAAEPAHDITANADELPGAHAAERDELAPSGDPDGPEPVAPPAPLEADHVLLEAGLTEVPPAAVPPVVTGEAPAARATTSTASGRAKTPATAATGEPAPAKAKAPAKRKAPAAKAPAKKATAEKAPAKRATAKKAPAEQTAAPAAPAAPAVKRPLVRAVRADALRLGAPSTGVTTTRVAARAAAPPPAASVVVVPDRDRFHRPECRFVRGVAGATTLPKPSATRQGYAPCGVCRP